MQLRAEGWSLARIAAHLNISKRTLVDWNQHSPPDIQTLKAVELAAPQEKILASHEAELTQLMNHLKRVEQELTKRELQFVSTENLYRFAGQLRLEIRAVRLRPAFPGETADPASRSAIASATA